MFSSLFLVAVLTGSAESFFFESSGRSIFQSSARTAKAPSTTTARRQQAEDQTRSAPEQQNAQAINGEASGGGGGGGGLVVQSADSKSQLFASFSALSLADQYDAVLTGLCAKILDSGDMTAEAAVEALKDPLSLIEEMNAKKIPASARSLMALVDVRNEHKE